MKYRQAGVDIYKAAALVERIRTFSETTRRDGWLDSLGGFGALFRLDLSRYRRPVLVSSTDGVGTKLRLAYLLNQHRTIGIDLVAMCVNDILAQGAEPLFFLDYLAVGSLDVDLASEIVEGISEGCRQAGCSLVGGETAEMPGFYPSGEYELAGFAVGVVDEAKMITGAKIAQGDSVIGLASNGVHSNGFSLIRSILGEGISASLARPVPWGGTLGEELLKPTYIYARALLPLIERGMINGLAHITGGGLVENLQRILPDGLGAELKPASWTEPPVFEFIRKNGEISESEMRRVFNLGLGYLLVVAPPFRDTVLEGLEDTGFEARTIGEIVAGQQKVIFI